MTRGDSKLRCSFCLKNEDEVEKLIAGAYAYICNECVDLCRQIIEEEQKRGKPRGR